ncbi:uncharacterized protein [Engystomops pustulosus]|uniref:uncharacterized protein n=1 Tax=Engystomops pustulosus TaxID=76066 RepID=UPI003AFA8373
MILLLNIAIALGFFVTSCDSHCHKEKNTIIGRGKGLSGCWRDNEMHPYESKWKTSDCQECTCYKKGMECCDHELIAVGYNPKVCVAIKVNCTINVVKKKNHSIPCNFTLLEIDTSDSSDSSDSSDQKDKTSSNQEDDDDDEPKIELSAYLELLSYFETPDDCEKKEEKSEEKKEEKSEEKKEEKKEEKSEEKKEEKSEEKKEEKKEEKSEEKSEGKSEEKKEEKSEEKISKSAEHNRHHYDYYG